MSSRTVAKNPVARQQVVTGTYTGDGAATQAIVGVGFQPRFMWIYAQYDIYNNVDYNVGFKTDRDGTKAKVHDNPTLRWRYLDDHIISLDVDGFTVGDGTGLANIFNKNAMVYTYVAFR